jgi:hypothetical protein
MEQQNQQVQWRRDKIQELCSKGYIQREILHILQQILKYFGPFELP